MTAPTVALAMETARLRAAELAEGCVHDESPLIFVGGSTFVVADLLAALPQD